MGFYNRISGTTINETMAKLIKEPFPTAKTHYYIETEDGRKSVYDRTIHEYLREDDYIPVVYSKLNKYAIPQLNDLSEIVRLSTNNTIGLN